MRGLSSRWPVRRDARNVRGMPSRPRRPWWPIRSGVRGLPSADSLGRRHLRPQLGALPPDRGPHPSGLRRMPHRRQLRRHADVVLGLPWSAVFPWRGVRFGLRIVSLHERVEAGVVQWSPSVPDEPWRGWWELRTLSSQQLDGVHVHHLPQRRRDAGQAQRNRGLLGQLHRVSSLRRRRGRRLARPKPDAECRGVGWCRRVETTRSRLKRASRRPARRCRFGRRYPPGRRASCCRTRR
jgi:hypothetical protein